jgi:tetratricopeptide (TPR) repeat protein
MTQSATAFPFSAAKHRPMPMLHLALRLLIVAVCLSLSQPFAALAQTNTPAPLPPAAQEALNKGIIAAKVPDYPLAIRFFEDARKIAPTAPVIYMNLGIAESKMPGRELRAIAWLGAYLAASPDAPNAAAVKEQIAVLEVRNQSNLLRLIKTVQDAANQTSVNKSENLCFVARLWVKVGNISEAVKIVDRIQAADFSDADVCKARAKREIAAAQEISNAPHPGPQSTADTKPPIQPVVTVADWTHELDGITVFLGGAVLRDSTPALLSTEPFLDLAGYLKSLPPSDKPQNVFHSLHETAAELVGGQVVIQGMLKRQATR